MDTTSLIARELAAARGHPGVPSELSAMAFDNDVGSVAQWLDQAAAACCAADYVLTPPAGTPAADTVYVEMNDFAYNTGEWYVDSFAFAQTDDPDDELLGEEVGDLRVPSLTSTGMAHVQRWFETCRLGGDPEATEPIERLVVLSLFDLLNRALRETGQFSLRLVARRHEEPYACEWAADTDYVASIHTDGD